MSLVYKYVWRGGRDGIVLVSTKAHISQEELLVEKLSKSGQCVPGVKEIRVDVIPL